ncbi:hypothetical protein LOTGIDRAFT_228232 [Lottia gigantea]|uniref:Uncharacterized protein n=1 Tax=Lottia gigantea TaxID=225164 RepID=V4AKG4_LOTGI|nr:hypothetical protein LOTGIDRAFT_228232 [Lottia gigantea]ESO97597.1 hypothetical protein LOTGIDRAFT_228232 [Lottia gigantea]
MTSNSVSVLCLSVAVLVAFASAQGYGNTIMISSEMPYVVSDVLSGGGLSVTWPGSRLINVVPSNSLQRIVPSGAQPYITQGSGIPQTLPRNIPNVMLGNGIHVLGGMPSNMPQVITGAGIQRTMPGVGMSSMMPGMGMPFITGDMMDVLKDYYQAADLMNVIGRSFGMNGYQYPAQRTVMRPGPRMLNYPTPSSSPSTATVAKTKTIHKQTDLKVSNVTSLPTTNP